MLPEIPMHTGNVDVDFDSDVRHTEQRCIDRLIELDDGEGVLILTDVIGATPSNIACGLLSNYKIRIVTGLNLPMLVRVLNYATNDLESLAQIAVEGGMRHIFEVSPEECVP